MKTMLIAVLFAFGAVCAQVPVEPRPDRPDALDDALALEGLTRVDLGWRPKGYWSGFPGDIPYRLRQFDDLLAEPLANVTYLRTMAGAARTYLDAEALRRPAARSDGALYQAVQRLGVDKRTGLLRPYSCNLTAEDTPLDEAILAVHRYAQRPTSFVTFGEASPYPRLEEDLAAAVEVVPEPVRPIIGRLVLNILDAHRWAELSLRNVPMELRTAVHARTDIGMEQVDALDYAPEFDDFARAWDEPSMWYAGLKCVQALDDARLAIDALDEEFGAFRFDWRTPLGEIIIRGGGRDGIGARDALLVVDLGGDDQYLASGSYGASTPTRPIGLVLDMGGNDRYLGESHAQGAGVCGIGIVMDHAGRDAYRLGEMGQGVGQFGLGALIDLGGDDSYVCRFSGQGCGYFGIGLLLDADGADGYVLHADGQGLGGCGGGVGVLADAGGDDRYEVVRDPAVTGRPSYHSAQKISVSNAQGCAIGRRGDGGDGHAWAGGLGALLDLAGDDEYISGNWSMGTGYWFGMGYLYDGGGDDAYRGSAYTIASGAHFCIGLLLDEGGNDSYIAEETSVNSVAFGHDFTVAMLVDLDGNDVYEVEQSGLGYSINRSVAALIDQGGDDVYRGNPVLRPGMARYDGDRFGRWDGVTTYFADATSLGLFLDVGGSDLYEPLPPVASRHVLHALPDDHEPPASPEVPAGTIAACGDGLVWLDPDGSPNRPARNLSIGVDREGGRIDWRPEPEKSPGRKRPR
jgi:hypothetical protein